MQTIAKAEIERLAALRALKLLDTPPAESFDRITRLAAAAVRVPVALISLVDETRQWFKSHYGLEVRETPREASFCAHAVQARKPLLVPDTLLDARFSSNPLVTGAPYIRAYVGVPIFTPLGHAIGSLCAIDRQPRNFDSGDIEVLSDLARTLEELIQAQELSKNTDVALQFAGERHQLFRDTFELAGVGMVHVSVAGKLMRANQFACEMLGYDAGGLDQVSVIDLTHPEDLSLATDAFRRLTAGLDGNYRIEKRLKRRDGAYLWCHLTAASRRAENGEPEYLIAVIQDITEIHRARDDLKQLHNSLEAANGALRVQTKNLLQSDLALHDSEHRLRAVADNVPALIGYWSADLICEFANEAYRAMFHMAPHRILGMHLKDLLGAERFESIEAHVRATLQGQPQRFRRKTQNADGAEALLDIRYVPDHEGNTVRGFFVLVTDTETPGIMSHLK